MMVSSDTSPSVTTLLECAHALHLEISTAPPHLELNNEAIFEIEAKLENIHSLARLPGDTRRELDVIGTALWNTCGQIASMRPDSREDQKFLSRVKTFAFILIDAAAPNTVSGNLRGLKASLSAAHSCIESRQLRLALRILESGAQRFDALKAPGMLVEQPRLQTFAVEYFALRAHLAWLKCRPDLADHFFSQVPLGDCIASREFIAQMCYKIGCHAMSANQHEEAIKWLNRAMEHVIHPLEVDSIEDTELKHPSLLVRHTLARAYSNLGTEEAKKEFKKHLEILKREHQKSLAVRFLELQALRDEAGSGDESKMKEFFESIVKSQMMNDVPPDFDLVLRTIINCAELTRQTFLAVFTFVEFSQCLSQNLSLEAAQSLVLHLPTVNSALVESGFIKLSAFVVQSPAPEETRLACIKSTGRALDVRGWGPLSMTGAHACLLFIWRHIDREFQRGQYSTARHWCQLVLEATPFQRCSEQNMLKVQKKLALCALNENDPKLSRQVLDGMSVRNRLKPEEDPQPDFESLYLKLRLLMQEANGALSFSDCMHEFSPMDGYAYFSPEDQKVYHDHSFYISMPGFSPIDGRAISAYENPNTHFVRSSCLSKSTFLQMCVLEAQLHGSSQEVMEWVQMFISRGQSVQEVGNQDVEGFLFSLFVLTGELERGHLTDENTVIMLKLLNLGIPIARSLSNGDRPFPYIYVRWICQASHRLAHDLLKAHITDHVEEALSTAEKFLLVLKDKFQFDREVIDRLAIYTTHLSVVWHILVIRSGSCDMDKRRAHYAAIREHVCKVQGLQSRHNDKDIDIFDNFRALGFEAALFREDWAELLQFFNCEPSRMKESMFSRFVESMLTLDMPQGYRIYMLQKIVLHLYNTNHMSTFNRHVFPFYLRVVFELCLAAESPDESVSGIFKDAAIVPEDKNVTFLTIAELVLEQAIITTTDEAYIMSDEHRKMHVHDAGRESTQSQCGKFPYPKGELVYLASVAFNQAVEFFAKERDVECQRWAHKAIRLAELIGDAEGDQLAIKLRERLAALFETG